MKYLKECFVEKIYHYDALTKDVWDNLKPNTSLNLSCNMLIDSDETIRLNYKDRIVGVLSDNDSKILIDFIKMGHEKIFEAKIIRNNENETDENRKLKVVIYIKSLDETGAKKNG